MQESDNRDPSLTAALRALAEDETRAGASSSVEARLLAEVRSIAQARRRRTHATVAALAAALFLAVAVPLWRATAHRPPADSAATHSVVSVGEVATAFFPLRYSTVPMTGGQIVRMQVPQSALGSFGLASGDVLDGASSRTVLADVLVGEDGLARAVRFVRPVVHEEKKR
jgi:hypothetical protein